MLTSRERLLSRAENHEEPGRVPIFFGANGATTMLQLQRTSNSSAFLASTVPLA